MTEIVPLARIRAKITKVADLMLLQNRNITQYKKAPTLAVGCDCSASPA